MVPGAGTSSSAAFFRRSLASTKQFQSLLKKGKGGRHSREIAVFSLDASLEIVYAAILPPSSCHGDSRSDRVLTTRRAA